jgi:hypothetical protein
MELRATWRAVTAVCVLAAAVSVVGCGSDIPTAPPTPAWTPFLAQTSPYPRDGSWVGTTSEGGPVVLTVARNIVVYVSLSFAVTDTCFAVPAGATSIPIGFDGTFVAFLMPGSSVTSPVTITGVFDSTTRMHGTIGAMTIAAGNCDTTAETPKAAMTYTAEQ